MQDVDVAVTEPRSGVTRKVPHAPDISVPRLLLAAGWLGILVGYLEVLMRVAGGVILGKTVHLDPNFVWMAPAADAAFFTIVTAIAIAMAVWRSRRASYFATVFVGVTLAILTVLYSYPGIHWAASLVFALGAGIQAARMARGRFGAMYGSIRRLFVVLAGITLLSAISVMGGRSFSERAAFAALPEAEGNLPNIVFIILDTVRSASASVDGYNRPTTPSLQELARDAVRFERAYATAPWTLPSHGSFFTGHYPNELSTDWERALDRTYPTLAEVLRDSGYRTAAWNANYLYGGAEFGLGRGFIHYEAYPTSFGQFMSSSRMARLTNAWSNRLFDTYRTLGRRNAENITTSAIEWMKDSQAPFFIFLNYFDAHEPYAPPAPYDLMFNRRRPQIRHVLTGQHHTPSQREDLRNSYDGAIAYVDREIGRLLAALDRAGIRDNTIVIVTSDHGEEFGEHGYMSHGNGLYVQSLHVPLLIAYPRRLAAGTTRAEPVTLRDLPATILALAGVQNEAIPGTSMLYGHGSPVISELNAVANQPAWYPVAGGAMQSIIIGRYHYILRKDGRQELYDLERDPEEQNNLALLPTFSADLKMLRGALRLSQTTGP